MTIGKWIKKWTVPSSGDEPWTVSLSDQGVYGCSCPRWKFKREECHHIIQVKNGFGTAEAKPEYVLAHCCEPTLKDGKLLIPLVAFGDTEMCATICYYLLKNGYSWAEVKQLRGPTIGPGWTIKAIMAHVERHGLAWRKCCANYPHTKKKGAS